MIIFTDLYPIGHIFLPDIHLLDQMRGPRILVDNEEDVTDIHDNASLVIGQVLDIATYTLPVPVEIDADQLTPGIHDRTARVASGGMGGGEKGHRQVAVG